MEKSHFNLSRQKFETLAIRKQMERTSQQEHSTPLFLSSSFVFDSVEQGAGIFNGSEQGNLYSRFSNPNTDEFIQKLCALEQCESGVATASGMAAVHTTFATHLKSGDHLLASKNIFGNSLFIITDILSRMGVEYTLIDIEKKKAWEAAVQSNTKMLFIETPSNPTLKLGDLSFLGELCKAKEIIFAVDNCMATPYLQQPAKFGADLVIHSATKFIDGQGRVLGGAIVGEKRFIDPCYQFIRRTGPSLSPFNAWVLSKSLETLAVRMDRHCSNAKKIAQFLLSHPDVAQVIYPHLKDFQQYDLAKKQMLLGGGLVGCELKGGINQGTNFLNNLKIHSLTANLGDCRSIATHPASTTHARLSSTAQLAAGITPGYVRFSVGLEHVDDLIKDIDQALNQSKK